MGNNIKAGMSREISIAELASMVKGRVVGSYHEEMMVTGTCAVDKYIENKVSFVRNRKYGDMLADLRSAVILLPEDLVELCERYPHNAYIIVNDVLDSMANIQKFFYGDQFLIVEEGISPTAKVDVSAKIGDQVYIGENVNIGGNTVIGDGTKIMHNCCIFDNVFIGKKTYVYPNVCIYDDVKIGYACVIYSGVAIGGSGFRFDQDIERKLVRKWLHLGKVIIGNRVEIGANSVVHKATYEDTATIISDDVKIDSLVYISHNVSIGARTIIIDQSCIGGSCKIGEDVWIGIGAAISNGLTIGNRAKVLLNAVVAYDVAEDEIVSGFYAMPHRQWKQVWEKLKSNKGETRENR